MQMEQFAEFLIQYIHAPLGGIALLSGGISLVSKWGTLSIKNWEKYLFTPCFCLLFQL